eukprot:TRINITY_DN26468_c0_g1_i1.p1 TRINITY_DN26468_c0_g1~~TRINITY_DN26468_c0_g1_i1.p1  ORF type:complete len:613 (+),score=153.23 TRINITY_DN26468_c0_g1_i1:208-1839(+)
MEDGAMKSNEEVVVSSVTVDGVERELDVPVVVELTKDEDTIVYEMDALREFNAKPTEEIRYLPYNQCTTDTDSPSCGYVVDSAGMILPYSSGYCCECTEAEILGLESRYRRGTPGCNFASSANTAHCLQMSPKWFLGSRIKSPSLEYSTSVTLLKDKATLAQATLTKSAKSVKTTTPGGLTVRASILVTTPADFASLEGQVLLVPTENPSPLPVLHLPETYFTLDGRECDKIGVSFEAFFSEGSKCFKTRGSCLNNQIMDIIAEDSAREVPRYILPEGSFSKMSSAFFLVMYTMSSQLLTLEIDAAVVTIKVPLGVGVIQKVSCSSPLQEVGWCNVTVVNSGKVAAGFSVGVDAEGIYVENRYVVMHLDPSEVKVTPFQIRNKDNKATTEGVTVTLMDADDNTLDNVTYNVTVKPTVIDKGSQGGVPTTPSLPYSTSSPRVNGSPPPSSVSCTSCPWYSPFCFVTRKCFLQAVLLTITVFVIIAASIYLIKHGYLTACIKFVCQPAPPKTPQTTPDTPTRTNPILQLPPTVSRSKQHSDPECV